MTLYPPLGLGLGLFVLTWTTMSLAGGFDQPKLPRPISATTAPAAKPTASPADRIDHWNVDEVSAAKQDCVALLKGLELDVTYLAPIKQGQCGTPQPLQLRAFGTNPRVAIDPPATLNCKMVATLARWFASTVQPLANTWLKSKISTIHNAASYDCRNRVGDNLVRLSEHAKANALDIMSFTTASGHTIAVSDQWGATLRELLQAPVTPSPAVTPPAKAAAAGGFAASVTVSASEKPSAVLIDPGAAAAKSHLGSVAIRQARLAEIARRGIPLPKPTTPEGFFVHAVHDTACNVFGTVLGPEANDAHKEHFHLDLTPRAGSSYCE